MKNILDQIYSYIDSHKDEMIKLWEEIVSMESYGEDIEKVNKVGKYLKEKFENEGFDCKLVKVGRTADMLVGTLGAERGSRPIIFSGHFDTAIPGGIYTNKLFEIIDDKAYGPGVLDMKGGIVVSLYVVKALNHMGYNERPIKILYAGDEEISRTGSNTTELMIEEAKGGLCAFNMETGRIDGSLCIGRKGVMATRVTTNGVEAHAGNDFSSGINAIEEMAHKIIELQKLTDLEYGVTVNVGTIKGGTTSNAIPAQCEIIVDTRFIKVEQIEVMKKKIQQVCSKTYIKGTTTAVEFINLMDPYETTEDGLKFFDYINKVSIEYGYGEVGSVYLGGASDAAALTIAGTPTICAIGVVGQWNHTSREYAIIETLFERAKLISTIILNLKDFKLS